MSAGEQDHAPAPEPPVPVPPPPVGVASPALPTGGMLFGIGAPTRLRPDQMLALQRTAGNAAVVAMLATAGAQREDDGESRENGSAPVADGGEPVWAATAEATPTAGATASATRATA